MRELDLVVLVSKGYGGFRNRFKRVDSTKKKAEKARTSAVKEGVREREAALEPSDLQVIQMLESHLYSSHYQASRYWSKTNYSLLWKLLLAEWK